MNNAPQPVARFSEDDEPYSPLLDYVVRMADEFHPSVDWDNELQTYVRGSSSSPQQFAWRYNAGHLQASYTWDEFLRRDDVQQTLAVLGVDPEKFWYALLFASDYTYGACHGQRMVTYPREELETFMQALRQQIERVGEESRASGEAHPYHLKIRKIAINKPRPSVPASTPSPCENLVSLKAAVELHIEGARKTYRLTHPAALYHLLQCYEAACHDDSALDRTWFTDEPEAESQTVQILVFSRLLRHLLMPFVADRDRLKRYPTASASKELLISRLVFFTRLSADRRFLGFDEAKGKPCPHYLRDYLKRYADYRLTRPNLFYWW